MPGSGGHTPEELESLLEDAFVLHDGAAFARLFVAAGLVVEGDSVLHGLDQIPETVERLAIRRRVYTAQPRRIYQGSDIALLIGDGVVNVARRDSDGLWRLVISVLGSAPAHLESPANQ